MTQRSVEVLVTQPDGTAEIRSIDPDWKNIKAIIGGWLEAVGGDNETWIAYGDEEGNLKGLDGNGLAAGILMAMRSAPVAPVGTVVFVGLRYVGGEDGYTEADVPADLRKLVFPLGE